MFKTYFIFFVLYLFTPQLLVSGICAKVFSRSSTNALDNLQDIEAYFESNPEQLLGKFVVRKSDSKTPLLEAVVVRGELPKALKTENGFESAGSKTSLLSPRSAIVDEYASKDRPSTFRALHWTWTLSSVGLVTHEVVNPGLLDNNLPILPIALSAAIAIPLVNNVFGLLQHVSGSVSNTKEMIEGIATSIVNTRRKFRPGVLAKVGVTKPVVRVDLIVELGKQGKLLEKEGISHFDFMVKMLFVLQSKISRNEPNLTVELLRPDWQDGNLEYR
jgi:hypothetical protein